MEKFKDWLQRPDIAREAMEVDLTVRVLTTGYWPSQNLPGSCTIPPSAKHSYDTFSHYYLNNHTGRRLALQSNLGFADINATFYAPRKEGAEGFFEKKHVLQVYQ